MLNLVPELLALHRGCERLCVYAGPTWLFSIDSAGNRVGREMADRSEKT